MLFFMHGDSWGQYGPTCDNREKLTNFCDGYREYSTGKVLEI